MNKENLKNAMMAEVTEQFGEWYHRYDPKDSEDVRQDCVLEILWVFATSALLQHGYKIENIQRDLNVIVKARKQAEEDDD